MWPNQKSCVQIQRGSSSKEIPSGMQKKSRAKILKKNFLNSLLTTAASDFMKNNKEVLGNHNKMKTFFFLLSFLKNPIMINKKTSEPGG